jgi:hypothetical protein
MKFTHDTLEKLVELYRSVGRDEFNFRIAKTKGFDKSLFFKMLSWDVFVVHARHRQKVISGKAKYIPQTYKLSNDTISYIERKTDDTIQ